MSWSRCSWPKTDRTRPPEAIAGTTIFRPHAVPTPVPTAPPLPTPIPYCDQYPFASSCNPARGFRSPRSRRRQSQEPTDPLVSRRAYGPTASSRARRYPPPVFRTHADPPPVVEPTTPPTRRPSGGGGGTGPTLIPTATPHPPQHRSRCPRQRRVLRCRHALNPVLGIASPWTSPMKSIFTFLMTPCTPGSRELALIYLPGDLEQGARYAVHLNTTGGLFFDEGCSDRADDWEFTVWHSRELRLRTGYADGVTIGQPPSTPVITYRGIRRYRRGRMTASVRWWVTGVIRAHGGVGARPRYDPDQQLCSGASVTTWPNLRRGGPTGLSANHRYEERQAARPTILACPAALHRIARRHEDIAFRVRRQQHTDFRTVSVRKDHLEARWRCWRSVSGRLVKLRGPGRDVKANEPKPDAG